MKAKLVNENIQFKRGLNPKSALGLGLVSKYLDAVEAELAWNKWHYEVSILSIDLRSIRNYLRETGEIYGDENFEFNYGCEMAKLKKKYKI